MNAPWADRLPRTAAVLERGLRDGSHLGAQIYVSCKGALIVDAAIGESREGVPMRSGTVNVWFSSGKPLTAVAVARLWESGRIDLDEPVAKWLPEFAAGGKETVTTRHLLTHTAGFRPADRLPDTLPWTEAVGRIAATPLEPDWRPGQRAGYQLFSSWTILGEIVRRIDGRPISRVVQEDIFGPLGMTDCWMGLPDAAFADYEYEGRLGLMHFVTQGRARPHPVWNQPASAAVLRPGGNVRGPIRALGQFYESLLPGGAEGNVRVVRPETVTEWTRRHRVGLFDETFRHVMDWGLGFGVNSNRYGAETVPYGFGAHASDAVFGHGGSQSSSGFADPAFDLAVAWVCNTMIGEAAHQIRARAISSAIYEDLGLAGVRH